MAGEMWPVYSGVRIGGQCVRNQISRSCLHDEDGGIGTDEKRNVGTIDAQGLPGPDYEC